MPTLRERILAADPSLTAGDILAETSIKKLPEHLAAKVASLQIEWLDTRVWGESYTLNEDTLRLGNRRGDHLAMHPSAYGYSPEEAEDILAAQVEGTILHETGHALWDHFFDHASRKKTNRAEALLSRALDEEGPVSTYVGPEPDDETAEMFAEAFRWWCVGIEAPAWSDLIQYILAFVSSDTR